MCRYHTFIELFEFRAMGNIDRKMFSSVSPEKPMPIADFLAASVRDIASHLEMMTDDEVFGAMHTLETASEGVHDADRDSVLSRIAVIENEIERRFPGEVLTPYRDWKKSQPLL